MIDFRYHLVSIVSIFLALGVGIVLGAGPLQSGIGSTLNDQVVALRAEKDALRTDLDTSRALVAAGSEYATAVTPLVVRGRLAGQRVAVVVLPNAERDIAEVTSTTLEAAGATVTDVVTLTEDWFDPALQEERATAAEEAATALGLDSDATGDSLLREVLAKLAASREPGEASASRTAALELLSDADLLDASEAEIVPAQLVVLVSGDFAGTQEVVNDRAAAIRALTLALDANSRATVVAGGAPVEAAGQPVSSDAVAAIREDSDASAAISTIDHAREGMGPAVVVLAVAAHLAGEVGHYGISEGATAVVPPVPTELPPAPAATAEPPETMVPTTAPTVAAPSVSATVAAP